MRSLALSAFLLPVIALAQGNQGGMIGGFAGGEATRLLLTPGDRTEWTFEGKPGEIALVDITSEVFDPAVTIIDEKGTKLAENDDVAPGQQRAAMRFPIPAVGKFRAVVTNYKGTAGGPFDLGFRKLRGGPLTLGRPTPPSEGGAAWVTIEKPGLYSLVGPYPTELLAPAGPVRSSPLDPQSSRSVFTVEEGATGIYLLANAGGGEWTVAPVESRPVKVGEAASLDLPAGTVRRLTFKPTTPYVDLAWTGGEDLLLAGASGDVRELYRTTEEGHLLLNLYGPGEAVIYASATDAARPLSTSLRLTAAGKPWNGPRANGELSWFGYDLWTFDVGVGERVTVQGESPNYRIRLASIGLPSVVESSSVRGGTKRVLIPERFSGSSAVLVTGGGRGPYSLTKETVAPATLAIGRSVGTGTRVYRVTGKKGDDLCVAFRRGYGSIFIGGTPGVPYEGVDANGVLRLRFSEAGERVVTVQGVTDWEIAVVDLGGGR